VKTIFITLAALAAICASGFAGDGARPAQAAPGAGLEKVVLAEDWTQCGGKFHYTFRNDGSFTLDGTLLGGSWKVEGAELILKWTNNWIVDRLTFDGAKQLFRNERGEDFNLRAKEVAVRLAVAE
jgi:hypothetical protein